MISSEEVGYKVYAVLFRQFLFNPFVYLKTTREMDF